MSKKSKGKEDASVEVRATHDYIGVSTRGMTVNETETIKITYSVDVIGRDMVVNREAAIEMYAQRAYDRVVALLEPIAVNPRTTEPWKWNRST